MNDKPGTMASNMNAKAQVEELIFVFFKLREENIECKDIRENMRETGGETDFNKFCALGCIQANMS